MQQHEFVQVINERTNKPITNGQRQCSRCLIWETALSRLTECNLKWGQ